MYRADLEVVDDKLLMKSSFELVSSAQKVSKRQLICTGREELLVVRTSKCGRDDGAWIVAEKGA